MRRPLAVLALVCGLSVPARANDAAEFSEGLGKLVGAFAATELYVEHCNRRDPANAATRRDVLAGWSHGNNRSGYDRLMQGLQARLPEIAAQVGPQRQNLSGVIAQEIAANPAHCEDLQAFFKANRQLSVGTQVSRLIRLSSRLGVDIPPAPEIVPGEKSLDNTKILRLAALSARLEAKMAEIGSKEGGRRMSDLSRARDEHARNWLVADGMQVLFGRVTAEDELREWRGDYQSAFKVECDSFVNDFHQTRMAEAQGEDRVLVGRPRSVLDLHTGGKLKLEKCGIFTVEEAGRPFVEEDDTAGLMPRPLEENEAYAGPNAGIALRQVDRVLYESSFDNRLDGFGNGYIDREENIYVLLRDGTAYRHEWSFPFTDLAVERSKTREPERWFTWSERRGKVTLTGSGGNNKGETIEIEKAQSLRPMRLKALQASYYYLHVGMGGRRQDRRYTFAADGTLVYHRSGFVAGNFATSYIIVNGRDAKDVTARYRFEDYALVVERDGETERHFFAVPESADKSSPDTVIVRGQAYWLDKK
ncbi:hypothetical protein [Terrihabitans sp. B22-R8]|uniref:hypothetical protein n=1 Tax=Terrihabitans sp. B22-R8 TaxID=3425128 RepID=UPI00403D4A1F